MKRRFLFCILFFPITHVLHAKEEKIDAGQIIQNLHTSAFVDTYYASSQNIPPGQKRSFTTQAVQTDQFSLNLGLVHFSYDSKNVRANLALQAGTYVDTNYAAEPASFRPINQANIGFKIAPKLWLDAGIFPSHIGSESAISKDNFTYTRSIAANYSPYYESGVRLVYQATEKLSLAIYGLNGWQNIKDNNRDKALGTQVKYDFSKRIIFNWSTFYGNEAPANQPKQDRYFSDFWTQFFINKWWDVVLTFDLGFQKKKPQRYWQRWQTGDASIRDNNNPHGYHNWYTTALIFRFTLSEKWKLATRAEYYNDPRGVIIQTNSPNGGFQTAGYSANIDYQIYENILLRFEAKMYQAKHAIFPTYYGFSKMERLVVGSVSAWF